MGRMQRKPLAEQSLLNGRGCRRLQQRLKKCRSVYDDHPASRSARTASAGEGKGFVGSAQPTVDAAPRPSATRPSDQLGEQIVRKRHTRESCPRFQLAVERFRNIADLNHPWHVHNMFACCSHFKAKGCHPELSVKHSSSDEDTEGMPDGRRHDDGVRQLWLGGHEATTQVWDEEIRLARLAAELGFDVLWSAEHHFFDYSFCPDNLQLMSYLAARCPNVDLGTAAVILPWHDPLRVAEQAAVLDHAVQGAAALGHRPRPGAARVRRLRGTMDESRERFDEAAPMIVERAAHRLHRGRRQALQAAADRDPAAAGAQLRRPDLCGGVERDFGRSPPPSSARNGDVLRPAVADAAAGDRAQPRAAVTIMPAVGAGSQEPTEA